jgi:hypothetical protein
MSPVEHELDEHGNRTGRTRRRQFTAEYAKAARSGVWPSLDVRAKWQVPFTESAPCR